MDMMSEALFVLGAFCFYVGIVAGAYQTLALACVLFVAAHVAYGIHMQDVIDEVRADKTTTESWKG